MSRRASPAQASAAIGRPRVTRRGNAHPGASSTPDRTYILGSMRDPTKPRLFDRLKLSANCRDTTADAVRAGKVFAVVGYAGPKPSTSSGGVPETPPRAIGDDWPGEPNIPPPAVSCAFSSTASANQETENQHG